MRGLGDDRIAAHEAREFIVGCAPAAEPTPEREPIHHCEQEDYEKCLKHSVLLVHLFTQSEELRCDVGHSQT